MCTVEKYEDNDIFDNNDEEGIDYTRKIECPYCNNNKNYDLADYIDDDESFERQMGTEHIVRFNFDEQCDLCGKRFKINGYISEYPVGAVNSEEINIEKLDEDIDE